MEKLSFWNKDDSFEKKNQEFLFDEKIFFLLFKIKKKKNLN